MRPLPLPLAVLSLLLGPWLSAAPVTVRDAGGSDLTLSAPPTAIVSLTLTTDELLFDLVEPKRLRAIDLFATDPGISNVVRQAAAVPVRIAAEQERVVALNPDLVFVAAWTDPVVVQGLRQAGLRVFVTASPVTLAGLRSLIGDVARLVGAEERGRQLLARVDARLAAVAARVKPAPGEARPRVLSYSFSGSTFAAGTSFDALVTAAGLVNAASEAGLSGWPDLSKETVLALDPDLIVLPSWSYDGKDDPEAFRRAFVADPVFRGLKAVRAGRVVILPDRHLQATSHYMVDGVEDLARAAWPQRF